LNKQLMGKLTQLLYKLAVNKKVKGKIEEGLSDFYKGLNQLINSKLFISAFFTILAYFLLVLQAYFLIIAMELPINFVTVTFLMAISSIITFIPISFSGLGTRDATLIYLFSIIALSQENAIIFSFLIFLTFHIFGGIIGAFCFYKKPIKYNFK